MFSQRAPRIDRAQKYSSIAWISLLIDCDLQSSSNCVFHQHRSVMSLEQAGLLSAFIREVGSFFRRSRIRAMRTPQWNSATLIGSIATLSWNSLDWQRESGATISLWRCDRENELTQWRLMHVTVSLIFLSFVTDYLWHAAAEEDRRICRITSYREKRQRARRRDKERLMYDMCDHCSELKIFVQ